MSKITQGVRAYEGRKHYDIFFGLLRELKSFLADQDPLYDLVVHRRTDNVSTGEAVGGMQESAAGDT